MQAAQSRTRAATRARHVASEPSSCAGRPSRWPGYCSSATATSARGYPPDFFVTLPGVPLASAGSTLTDGSSPPGGSDGASADGAPPDEADADGSDSEGSVADGSGSVLSDGALDGPSLDASPLGSLDSPGSSDSSASLDSLSDGRLLLPPPGCWLVPRVGARAARLGDVSRASWDDPGATSP